MSITRRDALKATCHGLLAASYISLFRTSGAVAVEAECRITDRLSVLSPGGIKFDGYLEEYLQRSINEWSLGVVPYAELAAFFRNGRPIRDVNGRETELFATGEMWGKAVRSAALFYRYTGNPELKHRLDATVADLLTTRRANGTISCSPIDRQPDGPMGDLWERKYVLLGLDGYYELVQQDPAVLEAMIDLADATIEQVGPPPKMRIVDLGWSPNKIESSTILEPIMRLYNRTGDPKYLDFARYIVEVEGGAQGHRIFDEVLAGRDPKDVGGVYPKAYEMLSLFEGLAEYYRVTGNSRWLQAMLNLFHNVIRKEITLIGNGGGDQPYHPAVLGEAWDNTAVEQTNPNMSRMMETCVGITWIKFCHQVLRLTADPTTVDYIELYAYNGLIGAMKPSGDGFSYVNLLNGVKTEPKGWGTVIGGVYVTCCNLNGPMGLATLPLVAVMTDAEGPVVNLYNPCTATFATNENAADQLTIKTDYPVEGRIHIEVNPAAPRPFAIKLRIPAWSTNTSLRVNGDTVAARGGAYAKLARFWSPGDVIELELDMCCRLITAPSGSHPQSNNYQALVRGPIVLARDENIDPNFDQPVSIIASNGLVDVKRETPHPGAKMQFVIPTRSGKITMVDYASVNSWGGKRVCTWLPLIK